MTLIIKAFDEVKLARFLFGTIDKLNTEEYKNHINDLILSLQSRLKYESTVSEYSMVMLHILKIFLKLHDEVRNDSIHKVSELSTKPIFDIIKGCINKNSDANNHLDNSLHKVILQLIPLLLKIALEQGTEEDICNVSEFYQFNAFGTETEIFENTNLTSFFLRIKSLSRTFSSLSDIFKYKPVKELSLHILSYETYLSDFFAKVLLNAEDKVAIHILLFSIPNYTTLCETYALTIRIWKHISETFSNTNEKHDRILTVMGYLLNFCFDNSKLEDKKDIIVLFFEDPNFWSLIQFGLMENNSTMKKQAMYLFKKSILILSDSGINIVSYYKTKRDVDKLKSKIFFWDLNLKDKLQNIFSDIITALEFLDEQQTHIIEPIFQMVEKLVQKISTMPDLIDFLWILIIYNKSLKHESTQVLQWGLANLLKLPYQICFDLDRIEKFVHILVLALNNTSVYYNNSALGQDLTDFLIRVTNLKCAKEFFSTFLREVCSLTWSSEALFFVTFSTSNLMNCSYWGENEIAEVKKFILTAFKTHNKVIRSAVQYHLLKTTMLLTDESTVTLKSILLLLSGFFNLKTLKRGNKIWHLIMKWLRDSYPVQEAEKILEKFYTKCLDPDFNEKSIALTLMLFYDVYGVSDCKNTNRCNSNCFITKVLLKILQSFKDIQKRLYCDKLIHDYYLLIIYYLMEETELTEEPSILSIILPFLNEILFYIQSQIKLLFSLKNFVDCGLYVRTFKKILEIQESHKIDLKVDFNNFLKNTLQDLELNLCSDSGASSMLTYCQLKILKIMIESSFNKEFVKSRFIYSYLLNKVNEPLKIDEKCLDKNNVQMILGKINSNFLEVKWQILEHYLRDPVLEEKTSTWGNVFELCKEAFNIGGYGVLCPVMSVLKKFIPKCDDVSYVKEIIHWVWNTVMERRKTDEFKLLIKQFNEMVFQESLLSKEKYLFDIFEVYINLIFSDSSLAVVNTFMKHIQQISIEKSSMVILCEIVARGLIYGLVQKKDEKLTAQICSFIEHNKICSVSDYHTSNEIRARAIQIILTLRVDNFIHRTFAKSLIQTLIKMENNLNKNKVRYFGNSYVHRVKHRLLQALLLLEPLVLPIEKEAEELLEWLYSGLVGDNSQPSVKYQQEWLLIRMLIRHENVMNKFWNYFCDSYEKKTKGICSLIAVAYHLFKLIPNHLTSIWIDRAVSTFLPLCMAQNFEIRLYGQVVLEKIFYLANAKGLHEVIDKYKIVHKSILNSIENGCKGNTGKNCSKLQKDFYLNVFHPLEHYSLQTIFLELPRLANVGCDEWISSKTFTFCGVDSSQINILVKNPNLQLEETESAKWVADKATLDIHYNPEEENKEEFGENYQKKMIPFKPPIPEWDEALYSNANRNSCASKKDGLIVVASLVDKIPNLGGLARTCEIFGTSEYVINSLKYVEDKQFTSLSVTAEKWVPVNEVKVQHLIYYILEMKDMGYTVVGAEQALHSQPLNLVKFPKKALLLLGNEKTGIPPNILPLLDICVEIPQIGVIRSLNVHVTGALFIWEYVKQNHFT